MFQQAMYFGVVTRPGKRVGSGRVMGQNGSIIKKGCFGSGRNGSGSAWVSGQVGSGSERVSGRIGSVFFFFGLVFQFIFSAYNFCE
ncbi:hypothetical protein Hanom_Chr00s000004g01608451 [Helianthus anomalus]